MDDTSRLQIAVIASTLQDFSSAEGRLESSGYRVVHVQGTRMTKTADLFAEFSAAFQFPWYFGRNWHAFDECMIDLDEWLPPGPRGYAVAVWHAESVLIKDKSALGTLIGSLDFIHQELAEPSGLVSTETGVTSPAPRGFQVLLHCEPDSRDKLIKRWTRAGGRLDPVG